MVRIGAAVPQTLGERGTVDVGGLRRVLRLVDEGSTFDSVWVADMPRAPSTEATTTLAFAAAATSRVRIGAGAVLTPLNAPFDLARRLATIDQLSEGRLIVGVTLGSDRGIYPAYGIDPRGRLRRYEEGVQLMRRLWSEGSVVVEPSSGAEDARVELKVRPAQDPHPPIWFGGRHVRALERAVRLGDGWIGAGAAATAEFRAQARVVLDLLEEGGRDSSGFVVSKRVYLAIGTDRTVLEDAVARWFARAYGDPRLGRGVAVVGDSETCVAGLQAVIDAGAELLILNPMFDEEKQLRCLREHVIPLLRST